VSDNFQQQQQQLQLDAGFTYGCGPNDNAGSHCFEVTHGCSIQQPGKAGRGGWQHGTASHKSCFSLLYALLPALVGLYPMSCKYMPMFMSMAVSQFPAASCIMMVSCAGIAPLMQVQHLCIACIQHGAALA
jgi:hypothetical protein